MRILALTTLVVLVVTATLTSQVNAVTTLQFETEPIGGHATQPFPTPASVGVYVNGDLADYDFETTVLVSISGGTSGARLLGDTSVVVVGGIATFSDLTVDLVGTDYTLTATLARDGGVTATSDTFDIRLGDAATLRFLVQPNGATVPNLLEAQPVVALLDAGGNVLEGDFESTITLTIWSGLTGTGSNSNLVGTTTVTVANGVAHFDDLAVLRTGASVILRATTDAGLMTRNSLPFRVWWGDAEAAQFIIPPVQGQGGEQLEPTPVVAIVDAGGNVVEDDSTSTIDIDFGSTPYDSSPLTPVLGGTVTGLTVTDGQVTVSDINIDLAGSPYTLSPSSGALTSIDTNGFPILSGGGYGLAFLTAPTSAIANLPFAVQPTVAVVDVGGNVAPEYEGQLTVDVYSGTVGSLIGQTIVNLVDGKHDFTDLFVNVAGPSVVLVATVNDLIGFSPAIEVNSPPHPPTIVSVDDATATEIVFTFEEPDNDGADSITEFRIYMRQGTDPNFAQVDTVPGATGASYTTVNPLTADTEYVFQVTAVNLFGEGSPSPSVGVFTSRPIAPAVAIDSFTETEVVVSFVFSGSISPDAVTLYAVDGDNYIVVDDALTTGSSPYTVTNIGGNPLTELTTYAFAVSGSITGSEGMISEPVTVTTLGPPVGVTFLVEPSDLTADDMASFTLAAVDAADNVVTTYTGDIEAVIYPSTVDLPFDTPIIDMVYFGIAPGSVPSDPCHDSEELTQTAVAGVAAFTSMPLPQANAYAVVARLPGADLDPATGSADYAYYIESPHVFWVAASSADLELALSGPLVGSIEYPYAELSISVLDDFGCLGLGNLATSFPSDEAVTITITHPDGFTVDTYDVFLTGGYADLPAITWAASGTATVAASTTGADMDSINIEVAFGAVTRIDAAFGLAVTLDPVTGWPSPPIVAGTDFEVTAEIYDAFGQLITNRDATTVIELTVYKHEAIYTAATFAGMPSLTLGIASDTNSISETGEYVISFSHQLGTDPFEVVVSNELRLIIVADAPIGMIFAKQPTQSVAGSLVAGPPTLVFYDQFGNPAIPCTADDVTVVQTDGFTTGTPAIQDFSSYTGPVEAVVSIVANPSAATNVWYLEATEACSGTSMVATSDVFDVMAAAPFDLVFDSESTGGTAAEPIAPFTVHVVDTFGNLVESDSSTVVTVVIDDATAGLAGTKSKKVTAGVVTFSDITIDAVGLHTLSVRTAGGAVTTAGTTDMVAIVAGPPADLIITTPPVNNGPAGGTASTLNNAITVEVVDAGGNVLSTGDNAQITGAAFQDLDGTGATLSGADAPTAIGSPIAFGIDKVGTYRITVDADTTPSLSVTTTIFRVSWDTDSGIMIAPHDDVVAGTTFAISGTLVDVFGNVVQDDLGGADLLSDIEMGGSTVATADVVNGRVVWQVSLTAAGTHLFSVTHGSNTYVTGSVVVIPADPVSVVWAAPANRDAAVSTDDSFTLFDQFGNEVEWFDTITGGESVDGFNVLGGVELSLDWGSGSYSGYPSFDLDNRDSTSGTETLSATIDLAANYVWVATLVGTDDDGADDLTFTSAEFQVMVGAPSDLSLDFPTSSPVWATANFNGQISVLDAGGNEVVDPSAMVTVTAAGQSLYDSSIEGWTVFGGVPASNSMLGLRETGEDITISITVMVGGTTLSGAVDIDVVPGPAYALVAASNPTVVAGQELALTVTLEDEFGNALTSSPNTFVEVSIESGPSDSDTAQSGSVTQAAMVGGTATLMPSYNRDGMYDLDLTVTGGISGISTTHSVEVLVGPFDHIAFDVSLGVPGSEVAGTTVAPGFNVVWQDSEGNMVTTGTDGPSDITIELRHDDGSGSLASFDAGTETVTTASGLASFADLVVNTAGDYYVTAVDDAGTGIMAVGPSFEVVPDGTMALAFAVEPDSPSAGYTVGSVPFDDQPVVELQDSFGNVHTDDDATVVTLALSSGTLEGTTTATVVAGVASFAGLAVTEGDDGYTLTATAPSYTSATSAPFAIKTVSDAPEGVSLVVVDETTVEIVWTAATYDGNDEVTHFTVRVDDLLTGSQWVGEVDATAILPALIPIHPAAQFVVSVTAVNAIGESPAAGPFVVDAPLLVAGSEIVIDAGLLPGSTDVVGSDAWVALVANLWRRDLTYEFSWSLTSGAPLALDSESEVVVMNERTLSIPPSAMSSTGGPYVFEVTVTVLGDAYSYSETQTVTVTANDAPIGGDFNANHGGVVLNFGDLVTFEAQGWVDPELSGALDYRFGFYSPDHDMDVVLNAWSQDNSIETDLPIGTVFPFAQIRDPDGAITQITLMPFGSITTAVPEMTPLEFMTETNEMVDAILLFAGTGADPDEVLVMFNSVIMSVVSYLRAGITTGIYCGLNCNEEVLFLDESRAAVDAFIDAMVANIAGIVASDLDESADADVAAVALNTIENLLYTVIYRSPYDTLDNDVMVAKRAQTRMDLAEIALTVAGAIDLAAEDTAELSHVFFRLDLVAFGLIMGDGLLPQILQDTGVWPGSYPTVDADVYATVGDVFEAAVKVAMAMTHAGGDPVCASSYYAFDMCVFEVVDLGGTFGIASGETVVTFEHGDVLEVPVEVVVASNYVDVYTSLFDDGTNKAVARQKIVQLRDPATGDELAVEDAPEGAIIITGVTRGLVNDPELIAAAFLENHTDLSSEGVTVTFVGPNVDGQLEYTLTTTHLTEFVLYTTLDACVAVDCAVHGGDCRACVADPCCGFCHPAYECRNGHSTGPLNPGDECKLWAWGECGVFSRCEMQDDDDDDDSA